MKNEFKKYSIFLSFVLSLMISANAQQIDNFSFENGLLGQNPDDWNFSVKNSANCQMQISNSQSYSGNRSLKITNTTALQNNVYGSLHQDLQLIAGKTYRLSFWIRGSNVNGLVFTLGQNWTQRFEPEGITNTWQKFVFQFEADPDYFDANGNYALRIISEDITDYAYIDKIQVENIWDKDLLSENGSFEFGNLGDRPAEWNFSVANGANCQMVINENDSHIGNRSLKITNSTSQQNNVYGSLNQNLQLVPGQTYKLTFYAKGSNVNGLSFVFGKNWTQRFTPQSIDLNWQKFEYEFKAQPDLFYDNSDYAMCILSEDITNYVYIDGLEVRYVIDRSQLATNRSFETGNLGQSPSLWNFFNNNGANCQMVISNASSYSGNRSLKITNSTPLQNNVYGCLNQSLQLVPGQSYKLSFYARGSNVNRVSFAFGKYWNQRFRPQDITSSWQRFEYEFEAKPENFHADGTYIMCIISEDITSYLYVDELEVKYVSSSGQAVKNGAFDTDASGQNPSDWSFSINNSAACQMKVSNTYSFSGNNSLKITNNTVMQTNTYGCLYQQLPLVSGENYKLSFYAKGKDVNGLTFIFGKDWMQRFKPQRISEDWQRYEFEFQAQSSYFNDNGYYAFRILSEDLTEYVYVDDIQVVSADKVQIDDNNMQNNHVYVLKQLPVLPLNKYTCIPDWLNKLNIPEDRNHYWGGEFSNNKDFKGNLAFAWENNDLIIFLNVKKAEQIVSANGNQFIAGRDSLQLRLSPTSATSDELETSDVEVGFSPGIDHVNTWNWTQNRAFNSNEIESYCRIYDNSKYFMVIRLKEQFLTSINLLNKKFSFNAAINIYKLNGNKEVAFLGNGIHNEKTNAENTLARHATAASDIAPMNFENKIKKSLKGKLAINGEYYSIWNLGLKLTDADGAIENISIPVNFSINSDLKNDLALINIDIPVKNYPKGTVTMDISINGTNKKTLTFNKLNILESQQALIVAKKAELTAMEQDINNSVSNPSMYLLMPLRILQQQISLLEQDYTDCTSPEKIKFYTERGEMACSDIEQGVAELTKLVNDAKNNNMQTSWVYNSTANSYSNGWLQATMEDNAGTTQTRKVFMGGYGHFSQVVNDIPFFKSIGVNIIQIEIGPMHFFSNMTTFNDTPNWDYSRLNYVLNAMETAWQNDVKICLLLSPHYMPQAILDQYPAMKFDNYYNFKYDFNHPQAKIIIKKYLETIIPLLKASPHKDALHSLCLSNEPHWQKAALGQANTDASFLAWLEDKYSTISNYNSLSQSFYQSFSDMIAAGITVSKVRYEFLRFKSETLADWHTWMASFVKTAWPEIPVHSKLMVYASISPAAENRGNDPELFSDFSDLNGNDNYMFYTPGGTWISNWILNAMYHSMQRSFKKALIFNSENHIINDGDRSYIPGEHIYTSTFQQYMQGTGAITTWLWRAITHSMADQSPDESGYIYRRPSNIIAQSKATLDANRLASEISTFCDNTPSVYILYSPTSCIYNNELYDADTRNLFTHLSFCGHKVGFVSERQLIQGLLPANAEYIFVPSVTHITTAAYNALKLLNNVRIIKVGQCFQYNQFGNALPQNLSAEQISNTLKGTSYLEVLKSKLSDIDLEFVIEKQDSQYTNGVVWTIVEDGNSYLINVVNYNHETKYLKLLPRQSQSFQAVDLISGQQINSEFSIPPLQPMLLKVDYQ